MTSTKERLAAALSEASLPALSEEAEAGLYDDFESPLAMPLTALVHRLIEAGTPVALALAERVREGEFDGTKEEAEAWYEREGKEMFGGKFI